MTVTSGQAGPFECVTLRSGHRAIRHTGHGEVMHPSVGPWAEANTLYVEGAKLAQRLSPVRTTEPLVLFDVGLGAAANAAAAILCSRALPESRPLRIISFETDLSPLRLALEDPEGFPFLQSLRTEATMLLERGSCEVPGLRWELIHGALPESLETVRGIADVVFHDPFSPAVSPALWSPTFFSMLRQRCAPGATLHTYSAATPIRVALLLAGFFVGYGPAVGTKQETTMGSLRRDSLDRPVGMEFLSRWKASTSKVPPGVQALPSHWPDWVENHPQWGDSLTFLPFHF